MAEEGRRVLVVCERPAMSERIVAILPAPQFDLHFAPDAAEAARLARDQFFELMLVQYPAQGLHMREFLDEIRCRRSPCRYSIVVFFSDPEVLAKAEKFRATSDCQILDASIDDETLRTAILEFLLYNTRHPLCAQVRLESFDPGLPDVLMTETVNVSMSGMLVRYEKPVVIGSRFVFSFEHPGLADPVRGVATVVRFSRLAVESVRGFAARFVSFVGEDGERFRSFIAEQPPLQPRT